MKKRKIKVRRHRLSFLIRSEEKDYFDEWYKKNIQDQLDGV
jgi:hypothetical protein